MHTVHTGHSLPSYSPSFFPQIFSHIPHVCLSAFLSLSLCVCSTEFNQDHPFDHQCAIFRNLVGLTAGAQLKTATSLSQNLSIDLLVRGKTWRDLPPLWLIIDRVSLVKFRWGSASIAPPGTGPRPTTQVVCMVVLCLVASPCSAALVKFHCICLGLLGIIQIAK